MRKEFEMALELSILAAMAASCGTLDNGPIKATEQAYEVKGAISTLVAAGTEFPSPTETPTPTLTPTETPTPTSTPVPPHGIEIIQSDGTRDFYPEKTKI